MSRGRRQGLGGPALSLSLGKDYLIPEQPLVAIFGNRSWDDLRRTLTNWLRRRTGHYASSWDIDDAISAAIVDLVDYWSGLESSISEDVERNWSYAITRGRWMGQAFLMRLLDATYREWPLDSAEVTHSDYDSDTPPGKSPEKGVALGFLPSAEDEYLDSGQDDLQQKRQFLAELPEDELESWLQSVLDGESTRECARRRGVRHTSVAVTRQRGRKRLRAFAARYGIEREAEVE